MSNVLGDTYRKLFTWPVAIVALLALGGGAYATRDLIYPRPLRLGFVATLSGKGTETGQAGRDGAALAVDECNENGGISGQPVELLVRDDGQDPQKITSMLEELNREQVLAVVGPTTSSMAPAAATYANQADIVVVSPTANTAELSHKDDMFLSLYPLMTDSMERLARYVLIKRKFHHITMVVDAASSAKAPDYAAAFSRGIRLLGGEVPVTVEYSSSSAVSFVNIATRVCQTDPECVLLLTEPIDSGMLSQQLRKMGNRAVLCACEWAMGDDTLVYGASAIEGSLFFQTFDRDCPSERYQQFRQRFRRRFGYEPTFASVHSYDATRILLQAISEAADRKQIKHTILLNQSFEGLQDRISFDEFGDVRREQFMACVRNGDFHVME